MRADRLLSLILLLQNRGRMTAAQLAAELEVSERTIYRDVESLNAAGIPVYADRGSGGGYRLLDGYRTRLTGLTAAEADSLFLTGLPEAAAQLGLGAEMAAASLKLAAALPEGLRERAERVRSRFHLDAPGWFRAPEAAPHLSSLADAVWRGRRVRLRYRRWRGEPAEHLLDPLGLVLKGGVWYLVARRHPIRPDGSPLTFRVSRVDELTVTEEPAPWPAGFDLSRYWATWCREFEVGRYSLRARVRLTERGCELVRLLSSAITAAAVEDFGPPGPDGRREGVLPLEGVEEAVTELAGYGPDIEVLDPPELREALAAHLRAALDHYTPAPEGTRR
ncbi:helix-turn-helix transcriptional regulator [Marinactinospora thermotolerans]|uniref:Predicted DNA-binding transcriptional regulator YafY, contains an HTH and WYL domains n=1 Tax=Marinactinospora thermotolerans DSM 45154 TaxID=1122192 RepID=A0A1T4NSE4_9ACTN|nr:WYL domain-containing protein [Marinactinospora thermotolerans]SJZ82037.1 Predicted DNA-binding transcriptional regulator YafY, contains an HTH and WYL domains [Marinactinospora thermotolerans DSM 45154]